MKILFFFRNSSRKIPVQSSRVIPLYMACTQRYAPALGMLPCWGLALPWQGPGPFPCKVTSRLLTFAGKILKRESR